jgi:polyhydroxyalkanoate synthase
MLQNLLARGEYRARVEAHRTILRFVNGIEWLIRDPQTVIARTPYDVVYERDKLQVRRYRTAQPRRPQHRVPLLLVPPLMVKPFIFDLFPGRSLVSFLLEQGFAVYLVDFGEPDEADEYVTLDDYVLDWMPAACRAVTAAHRSSELSAVGYCMGGLFALMHVAVNRDPTVRNIVSIGSPVDVDKVGVLAWVAKLAGGQIEFLARQIGNVPGGLSSAVFRMLTPMKNFTRYADLFMNMWDREYVKGFDAMNQWVGQFIDYPQGAFLQFVHDFVRRNKLVRGRMVFGGKVADLRRVHASLLVFAGRSDQIASPPAVRAALDAVGSRDKSFRLVPGGHMGVLAGASAPQNVWQPTAEWLAARSQPRGRQLPRAAKTKQRPPRARPRRAALAATA